MLLLTCVVLMSATINVQLYSDYFHGAPIIMVPGHSYPVELEYIPLQEEKPVPLEFEEKGRKGQKGRYPTMRAVPDLGKTGQQERSLILDHISRYWSASTNNFQPQSEETC